jgi:hypothetical protein
MKKNNIIKGLLAMLLMAFTVVACEDYNEPLLTDAGASSVFTPIGLTAKVSKQTTVTVSWTPSLNTNHYVLDISAEDPNFGNIYKTMNVTEKEIPVAVTLEGLTKYYIRVKAISSIGLEDSKYTVTIAETLGEQLFLPVVDGDIKVTSATLRWVPNSNVTNITVTPGNINHIITADEKISGIATITGLVGEVTYEAILLNGTKPSGKKTFKTEVDPTGGIQINPTDDLSAKIAAAPVGAKLILSPGDYTVYSGSITLTKPISLYGLYSYNKPKVHLNFFLNNGATDLKLQDLDLNGDKKATASLIQFNNAGTTDVNYGDISLIGCNIHDYDRSLAAGNTSKNRINSFKVDNCVVTNILTSGGEFINFRLTYVAKLSLTNSTFNNCAAGDFIRADAGAGNSGTGLITDVLINYCTISNKSMSNGARILYVRFVNNSSTVTNNLFADTAAIYTNQSSTTAPSFSNNNYYNSPNLFPPSPPVSGVKYDTSTNLTKLNPNFVDADNGDFTVTNQTLIDNKVGDPRWLD